MTKVFISQPMRGLTDEEIKENRNKGMDAINKLYDDAIFLNSIIDEDAPEGMNEPVWYLSKSIEMMAQADVVVFLPGWESTRGCVVENVIATKYGYDTILIEDDYKRCCRYINLND